MERYFTWLENGWTEVNPLFPPIDNIVRWEEDEEQPGYFYALTREEFLV